MRLQIFVVEWTATVQVYIAEWGDIEEVDTHKKERVYINLGDNEIRLDKWNPIGYTDCAYEEFLRISSFYYVWLKKGRE